MNDDGRAPQMMVFGDGHALHVEMPDGREVVGRYEFRADGPSLVQLTISDKDVSERGLGRVDLDAIPLSQMRRAVDQRATARRRRGTPRSNELVMALAAIYYEHANLRGDRSPRRSALKRLQIDWGDEHRVLYMDESSFANLLTRARREPWLFLEPTSSGQRSGNTATDDARAAYRRHMGVDWPEVPTSVEEARARAIQFRLLDPTDSL